MFIIHTSERSDITWEGITDCKEKQNWLANFPSPSWMSPRKENHLHSKFKIIQFLQREALWETAVLGQVG